MSLTPPLSPHRAGGDPADGTTPVRGRRRIVRSVAAVLNGFITVVVLSLATDHLLHVLEVYPPWGEPMHAPALNLLALTYRCVFTVVGMYITARLAPYAPMHHALIGGVMGTIIGAASAIAVIPMNLGPAWYPVALALTALPCAWLGGAIALRRTAVG